MPRHFPDPTTVHTYIAHEDAIGLTNYSSADTMGDSSKPGYKLQSRGRRENYYVMRGREGLRQGFDTFLSETETNDKIGDAARKHFPEVTGVEQQWRSCVHAVAPVPHTAKGFGKRFGHPQPTGAGQEISDIPRGMKHVAPPREVLGDEMDLFATRRGRVYTQDGVNMSNAQSIPSEVSYSEHPQKRHGAPGDRNGLPMRNPGDKAVAAVEFTPAFFGSQKHRLGLEPPVVPMQRENRFAEKEARLAIQRDKQDVANLPKYPKGPAAASTKAHDNAGSANLPTIKK